MCNVLIVRLFYLVFIMLLERNLDRCHWNISKDQFYAKKNADGDSRENRTSILQIDTMIHRAINLFPRTALPMPISAKCLLICEDESAARTVRSVTMGLQQAGKISKGGRRRLHRKRHFDCLLLAYNTSQRGHNNRRLRNPNQTVFLIYSVNMLSGKLRTQLLDINVFINYSFCKRT